MDKSTISGWTRTSGLRRRKEAVKRCTIYRISHFFFLLRGKSFLGGNCNSLKRGRDWIGLDWDRDWILVSVSVSVWGSVWGSVGFRFPFRFR